MSDAINPFIFGVEGVAFALKAAGVALWSWDVNTDEILMDERGYAIWGMPKGVKATLDGLSKHIHPEDLDRVRAAFSSSRAVAGQYETDFRILFEDEIRWIAARGQGQDMNIAEGVMFGIFIDVTERKQAEEANELLAGEMSHRLNNLLSVAAGLAHNVGKSSATVAEMVSELTNRLVALGRAHSLAHASHGTGEALLGDLLTVLLSPYGNDAEPDGRRIRISVPKMAVGTQAATTLALVVHELATNSIKYGALSTPDGSVDVSSPPHVGEEVTITWVEQGGPTSQPHETTGGYGSKMLGRSMANSLGGSVEHKWIDKGLVITLRMNKGRLAR